MGIQSHFIGNAFGFSAKKLELAETDFETQAEQAQVAESKIEAVENEARQLKKQLDEHRENSGTQGSQIDLLKQELADQTDEIKRLQAALDEALAGATEKTGLPENSESQYQKLADELAESKRSQVQTELAAAKEELQSLSSKTVRVEQEMETAYQEMPKKGGFVTELESKVASFETLTESLQKKLELAESDF